MLDIAVLASGRGSNLRAIGAAIDAGQCDARIVGVVSDRRKAAALEYAEERGIRSRVVPLKKGDDRALWNQRLADEVAELRPALVVLAGFMRVLGSPLLERFPGRIINVHPAILPAFPGHDAPEQAIAAGVRVSGCSVHVVDAGVDTGPVIAQAVIPVALDDTPASLHERIQVQEHRLLPKVVHEIARGRVRLDPLELDANLSIPAVSLTCPDL